MRACLFVGSQFRFKNLRMRSIYSILYYDITFIGNNLQTFRVCYRTRPRGQAVLSGLTKYYHYTIKSQMATIIIVNVAPIRQRKTKTAL